MPDIKVLDVNNRPHRIPYKVGIIRAYSEDKKMFVIKFEGEDIIIMKHTNGKLKVAPRSYYRPSSGSSAHSSNSTNVTLEIHDKMQDELRMFSMVLTKPKHTTSHKIKFPKGSSLYKAEILINSNSNGSSKSKGGSRKKSSARKYNRTRKI
jgi:hypothetical protein